jgi:hypothetical protein
MVNGDKFHAIVIDFSNIFDLVPHDRLFMKIAISDVGSRVVAWVRKFLLGGTERESKRKGKLKCTLVQALRFCTGCTIHRRIRGMTLVFLDHGTRRG